MANNQYWVRIEGTEEFGCTYPDCDFSRPLQSAVQLHYQKTHLGVHGKRGKGKPKDDGQAGTGTKSKHVHSWRLITPADKEGRGQVALDHGYTKVCEGCDRIAK